MGDAIGRWKIEDWISIRMWELEDSDRGELILADQVLFEFYQALRDPRILEKPLAASEAAEHIRYLREDVGVARCCYELSDWTLVWEQLTHLPPRGRPDRQARGRGRPRNRRRGDFLTCHHANAIMPT